MDVLRLTSAKFLYLYQIISNTWVDNNSKIQKTENFILIQGNMIYWAYHFVYLDIKAN